MEIRLYCWIFFRYEYSQAAKTAYKLQTYQFIQSLIRTVSEILLRGILPLHMSFDHYSSPSRNLPSLSRLASVKPCFIWTVNSIGFLSVLAASTEASVFSLCCNWQTKQLIKSIGVMFESRSNLILRVSVEWYDSICLYKNSSSSWFNPRHRAIS